MYNRNWGCQVAVIPSIGSSKFFFLIVGVRWIKFLQWVDITNILNLTKLGGATMGFPHKRAFQILNFFIY